MKVTERRQLARLNLRTPLRFRALGVASDKTEHFTEALNVSRGGFFFASSDALHRACSPCAQRALRRRPHRLRRGNREIPSCSCSCPRPLGRLKYHPFFCESAVEAELQAGLYFRTPNLMVSPPER